MGGEEEARGLESRRRRCRASKEIMKLRARKVLALLTRGRAGGRRDEGKYSASISVRGCLSILDEYKVLRFRPTPSPTRRNKFAIGGKGWDSRTVEGENSRRKGEGPTGRKWKRRYIRVEFFSFFSIEHEFVRMIRINLIVNDLLLCYVLEIFRRVEFFMSNIFETDCDENIKYLIIWNWSWYWIIKELVWDL